MGSGISIPTLNINTPGLRLSINPNATSYVKLDVRSSDTAKLRRSDADKRICIDVHVKVLEGAVHGTYMAVKSTSSIDQPNFTQANESINQPINQSINHHSTMPAGHGPLPSIPLPSIGQTPITSHPDAGVESKHQSFLSTHSTQPLPNGDVHLRLLARHTSNFMPASYFLSIVSGSAKCTVDVTAVISTLPLTGQHQHSSVIHMGEVPYVTRPHATEQRPAILHDDEYIEALQWRIVDLERELGQAACHPLQTHQSIRLQKENARLTLAIDDLNREIQSINQSGVGVRAGSEYVTQLEAINQSSKQTIRELTVRLEEAREHLANKRDRINQLDNQSINQSIKIRELEGRLDQYRHEKNQLIQTAPINQFKQSVSQSPNHNHDLYDQPANQSSNRSNNQSMMARSYDVPFTHDDNFRPKTAPDQSNNQSINQSRDLPVNESYNGQQRQTYDQSYNNQSTNQSNRRFNQLDRLEREDKANHRQSNNHSNNHSVDQPLDQTVKIQRERLGRSISPHRQSTNQSNKQSIKQSDKQSDEQTINHRRNSDDRSTYHSDDDRPTNQSIKNRPLNQSVNHRDSINEDRKRESPRRDQSINQSKKQSNQSKEESFVVHHARDHSLSPHRSTQSTNQSVNQSNKLSDDKYSINVSQSTSLNKEKLSTTQPVNQSINHSSSHSHKPVGQSVNQSTNERRSRSRSRSRSPVRNRSINQSTNQSTNQPINQSKDRKHHSRSPSPKRRDNDKSINQSSKPTSARRSSRSPERKIGNQSIDDRKNQSTSARSIHRSRSRSPPSVKRGQSINQSVNQTNKQSTLTTKRSNSPPSAKRSPSINQSINQSKRSQSPPPLKRDASANRSKRSDSPPSRKGSDNQSINQSSSQSLSQSKRSQSPPPLKRDSSINRSKRSDSPPSRNGPDSVKRSNSFNQSINQSSNQSTNQSNNQLSPKKLSPMDRQLSRADEKDDRLQRKTSSSNMKRIIEV